MPAGTSRVLLQAATPRYSTLQLATLRLAARCYATLQQDKMQEWPCGLVATYLAEVAVCERELRRNLDRLSEIPADAEEADAATEGTQ